MSFFTATNVLMQVGVIFMAIGLRYYRPSVWRGLNVPLRQALLQRAARAPWEHALWFVGFALCTLSLWRQLSGLQ